MGTTRQGRVLRTLISTLVLTVVAGMLLAGSAFAAGQQARGANPGKPTATAPKGTITSAKPTFTWSKAPRARSYELRVYKGTQLQLKKAGLKKRSWTSTKSLPAGADLSWKVRARNDGVYGPWSRSVKFKIVPLSPAKAITAFSFQGLDPPVAGVIDEGAHTIALTVPFGTPRSALVATFTTTGAAVRVGATTQVSGVTANDFSSPVTYTVTAADGTTQDYVVTVTVAALDVSVGDSYGGGIVAYIFQPGDPGYVAGQTHGLIAATTDQTGAGWDGISWATIASGGASVEGAKATALGAGAAGTAAIISQYGDGATYAAGLAHAYRGGGYSDWFLPSKDELDKLYQNRAAVGGFHTATDDNPIYWTSSQWADLVTYAWAQVFETGNQGYADKIAGSYRVRAVREF